MKMINKIAAWSLAGAMGISIPMTALAGSPEFSRSAEEWTGLKDNVLEYEEIGDLIHEYNVTVQNNQYDYNQFIKDYGKTREDIADSYRDLADDLESSKSGEDSGAAMVSDLQLELQAKQLREQADDNLEDSQINYWTYEQAEDNLALSAQSKFISYYKKQLELESAQEELKNMENDYNLAVTRRQAGTVTEADVLNCKEQMLEQEKTVSKLEQEIESTRQKLIVMLGWSGSDQPEIKDISELDLSEYEDIDLEADKQKAQENNYTLKINKRKLENAKDDSNKEKISNTIEGNQRQINVSVTSAWQNLQTAKLSYEQAQADLTTEQRNMELTQQKWNAGMITKYEYEKQQSTLSSAKNSVKEAKLSLLETLETYRWNVNGLASAE
jgi:outer membrane protein TolC